MSVKIDENGRRSVQVQAEIPGTPEQVWEAISTGPGVSSWFVPCTIDGRVGGSITSNFGPGMDSTSKVTEWEPPRRLVADTPGWQPGSPTVATEWIVEAVSGDTCIVRVVHSWFAETDEWDAQYEDTELGWTAFFRDLRLYVMHFAGQASSTIQLMGFSTEPQSEAWKKLATALALAPEVGARVVAPEGAPSLAGKVEWVGIEDHPESLMLLDSPAPGICHLFAMPMGPMTALSIRLFFYGDQAAEFAAEEGPSWTSWVEEHFPKPAEPATP